MVTTNKNKNSPLPWYRDPRFIIPIVLSILSFFLGRYWDSCSYYKTSAAQYRPIVTTIGRPILIPDSLHYGDLKRINLGDLMLPLTFDLTAKFQFTNTGNSIAYIQGLSWLDTVCSDQDALKRLEVSLLRAPQSLPTYDTVNIDIPYRKIKFEENHFVLHLLLIYKNETEVLFYSYFRYEYTALERDAKIQFYDSKFKASKKDLIESLIFERSHEFTDKYSEAKAATLLNLIGN